MRIQIKNMIRRKLLSIVLFAIIAFSSASVFAANEGMVDYGDKVIIDSDLDGLTDEGEVQIYGSDPQNKDSDNNGLFDGAEIMGEVAAQEAAVEVGNKPVLQSEETPWAWYVSRMSALVGFAFLYVSMVMGLAIRIPSLRTFFGAKDTFSVHCWISLQATLLAFIHGGALIFDKFINFSLKDVFIPFASAYRPHMVALGVIAFYLMLILVITSYLKTKMPHKLWRSVHFFNIILYVFSVVHAWQLGTDLSSNFARAIFFSFNSLLAMLVVWHLIERIKCRRKAVTDPNCEIPQQ